MVFIFSPHFAITCLFIDKVSQHNTSSETMFRLSYSWSYFIMKVLSYSVIKYATLLYATTPMPPNSICQLPWECRRPNHSAGLRKRSTWVYEFGVINSIVSYAYLIVNLPTINWYSLLNFLLPLDDSEIPLVMSFQLEPLLFGVSIG